MIPHDTDAELAVLGACMVNRAWRETALSTLTTDDFYTPEHRAIFLAITRLHAAGEPADPGAVGLVVGAKKDLVLAASASAPLSITTPLAVVADRAARRRLLEVAEQIADRAQTLDDDPADIVASLERAAESVRLPVESSPPPLELDAFLEIDDPADDFVIPKCLARGDRLMLTSGEGVGKSELQLQMAVMVASGVHPFYGYGMRAARVLVVDLENSARQLRKRLPRLRHLAGDQYRGLLRIETRGAGINLRDPRDARWLDEKLEQTGAELLVIGPLYKMFRAKGSESKADETAAEEAAYAIDRLRIRHNVAVSIEAHSPHGHQGDRENYRPIGASLWLRWPEFGLALKPVAGDGPQRVDLKHWRGARDRDRSWPSGLIAGGSGRWPWLAVDETEVAA